MRIDPTSVQVNKLAGITYNNLACYYKKYFIYLLRLKKPKVSLIYLEKALDV